MTIKKIKNYIEKELNKTPKHNCKALAKSITKVSKLFNENENELMYLLLENKPINGSYTHSYGFHTAYGRDLINNMSEYYYKYNQ